ncbi:MAG TPA: YihY/virulence factor BrkB family protein [Candidatus Limnocylindrales bacterium]|nr:YihY/virulence factor BrkB family protein [Candidatus Limnocylindrales bacterium]
MDGRDLRPSGRRRAVDRLLRAVTPILGSPRVATARRVIDRFGAVDGGLLAAGIAYNAVLALIPLGLLASGLAGFLLVNPESRADVIVAIGTLVPPLEGVVAEIVGGLSAASPSLSLIGLVLAAWGTSRLYASLESAVVQLDTTAPRRGLLRRTARRLGSIAIVAGVLLAALLAAPVLAVAVELRGTGPLEPQLLDLLLAVVPPAFAAGALAAIYRVIPVRRPTWRALSVPAIVGAVVLVLVTRLFVFLAPRILGANVVYGTLGAILVGLTWLDIAFTVVLLGAAWVDEREAPPAAAVA